MKLIDKFVVSWALLAIGLGEIVGVIYIYGKYVRKITNMEIYFVITF